MDKKEQINTEIVENNDSNPDSVVISDKKTLVKKVLNTSLTVVQVLVVVFLLVISLLSMSSTTQNASGVSSNPITGTSLFPVLSDSMAPTFKTGDLVYGKQFSEDKDQRIIEENSLKSDETEGLNKGDIIIYWGMVGSDRAIITHRIRKIDVGDAKVINGVEYHYLSFWTRGDAQEVNDSTLINISEENIVGYYKGHVKGVGAIITTLQNNTTLMFFVLPFPLILLFLWNGFSFVRMIFVNKKETAIENIEAAHEEEKQKLLEEAKRLALEELRKEMAKSNGQNSENDKK